MKRIVSEKEKKEYKERRSLKKEHAEAGAALLFPAPSVSAH